MPSDRQLRIAILGCGQIADAHLQELAKASNVAVIATCDRHLDLALQAAQRFDVPRWYDDLDLMLARENPDIVHVATPAQSHAALASRIMVHGAHVYVEKPLALDEREVREVLATARAHRRIVCAGHDQLFDPAWLELKRRVATGEIGEPRHVESILGYPISGQFGTAVSADPCHWVRQLPGGLFQNTISHPLYRITDYLEDERPLVFARWWNKDGLDYPTEMLVHLRGKSVTGTLTFSTTIPAQRMTRVYGTRGTLEIDLDAQTIVRLSPPALPGAFGKLDAPWSRRREAARAFRRNLWRFARSDIHYFAGLRTLFERFHEAVRSPGSEWPISASEMLRVTRVMDEIFAACRQADLAGLPPTERESTLPLKAVHSTSAGTA